MAKATEKEKEYAKEQYRQHKEKRIARQRAYRATIKAKRADNIANGRPPNEGIPVSQTPESRQKSNKKWVDKNKEKVNAYYRKRYKKKSEGLAKDRARKNKHYLKKKEQREKELLEAYERDFGKKQ